MTKVEFWNLIERARREASATVAIPQWLTSHLEEQPVECIVSFEEHFYELFLRAYDARLWAAACLMCGMCSDDTFMDFRGWLIAQGQVIYERALENPDSLAGLERIDGDSGGPTLFYMTSAASEAYREKIGDRIADLPVKYKKPVLLHDEACAWDSAKAAAMFPKLYARYSQTFSR